MLLRLSSLLTSCGAAVLLPLALTAQIVPPLPKNPLGKPKPVATNNAEQPAATPRPYAGTFVGQDLTLELQWNDARSRYEGTVVHDGERMPCQGTVRDDALVGTFVSEGENYEFTLRLTGDKATVTSDGETYNLMRKPVGNQPAPQPNPQPKPQPRNDGGNTGPVGGCGLAFQPNERGELVVAGTAPGGAAERAKVPVGAVLRAVDGKKVAGLSMEQVRQLCLGPVDSMVTLTFETDREVLDFVLQRRPLPQQDGAPTNDNGAPANGPGTGLGADGGDNPAAIGDFPAWLRPGARATYFSGVATLPGVSTQLVPDDNGGWRDGNGRSYREDQVPGTGGGGYTQYDFVSVTPDCLGVMMSIHTFADAGLQQTTQTSSQPLLGDRNGLTDLWVPPAKLRALVEQQGGGLTVRRVKYPLNGRTFDAVVTQSKSDSGYQRYTYDLDTGLLLVFSASSTGANVATRVGNQIQQGAGGTTITSVVLRNVRTVQLPWTGQQAPQWLQQGKRLDYAGSLKNSLAEGTLAPWRYGLGLEVTERRGDCTIAKLQSMLDYGTGAGPQTQDFQLLYGPASFANLFLDPRALQRLQRGQELDRDPVTGRRLVFVGSDGRTATIAEQGPLDQQSYSYDLQSGVLVATTLQQQQGPATITTQLQLQQR